MLISQKLRIGFIHIPKCGGTTIKQQFSPIADTETSFAGVQDHPQMGKVFMGHLPLWALRDYYPSVMAAMEGYRLFALCRDPHDRFESAISQRMQFLHKKRINDVTYPEALDFVSGVIDKLLEHDRIVAADLCHFIPQSEFVRLDNQIVVQEIYPLSRIDQLTTELSRASGIHAATGFRANQTLDFRFQSSEGLLRKISGQSKKILPIGLHSWTKQTAKRLLTRGGNRYDGFSRREPEIQAFVRSYYEQDFDLVDRVHAAFKGKPEVAG